MRFRHANCSKSSRRRSNSSSSSSNRGKQQLPFVNAPTILLPAAAVTRGIHTQRSRKARTTHAYSSQYGRQPPQNEHLCSYCKSSSKVGSHTAHTDPRSPHTRQPPPPPPSPRIRAVQHPNRDDKLPLTSSIGTHIASVAVLNHLALSGEPSWSLGWVGGWVGGLRRVGSCHSGRRSKLAMGVRWRGECIPSGSRD